MTEKVTERGGERDLITGFDEYIELLLNNAKGCVCGCVYFCVCVRESETARESERGRESVSEFLSQGNRQSEGDRD